MGVCRRTLAGMGLRVQTARTGHEALALLQKHRFDFILTDLHMPGGPNGAALVEEVKHRSPATDIVIMTGSPSVETAVGTLTQGACDYLLKPFHPGVLESLVARCIEKRRLAPELNREESLTRELQAAYAELNKVERLKDGIIAALNHELRTPLTIALSASALLAESTRSPQTEKYLDLLLSSLSQEKEVVESLLLFAKLQGKELPMRRSAIDLRKLLEELVANYRLLWEKRSLSVEVRVHAGVGPLHADEALVRTALKHLLLNAIQFNKKGGRITIEAAETDSSLSVAISDTGIGIPPDKLSLVSDSFYQVAEHLTRQVGGLGLGLAIARRIVEAHHGTISAASRDGEGSVFTLSLPTTVVEVAS